MPVKAPPMSAAGTTGPGCATMWCLFGPRPEHRARALVTGVLTELRPGNGLGLALGQDELADVNHAVNEMVTNAHQHAPRPYELRIFVTETAVKIAVMDGGGDHAAVARRLALANAEVPDDNESGRGLQIVAGLFPGCCGAEPTSTCTGLTPAKQVWIAIPRTARFPAAQPRHPQT